MLVVYGGCNSSLARCCFATTARTATTITRITSKNVYNSAFLSTLASYCWHQQQQQQPTLSLMSVNPTTTPVVNTKQQQPRILLVQQQQQQQQSIRQQEQQCRYVHSATQIKRLFKKNAARKRIQEKLRIANDKNNNDNTKKTEPSEGYQLQQQQVPKYPPIYTDFVFLPNGWSAPPPPPSSLSSSLLPDNNTNSFQLPNYPFHVTRTKNKPNDAIGFLPVYTKYRKDGTKITTRIRHVTGNRDIFLQELKANLLLQQQKESSSSSSSDWDVRIRTGGAIEIKGNHVRAIKLWLAGLGF